MEDTEGKRAYAHTLVEAVPAEKLDNLVWVLQQYAAPGLNKK